MANNTGRRPGRAAALVITVAALGTAAAGCGGSGSPQVGSAANHRAVVTQVPTGSDSPGSARDMAWAAAAHQGNMAEVKAGKLAAARGATPTVRSIGRTLATDHDRLDTALRKAAATLDIAMPIHVTPAQRAGYAALATKHGGRFDRAFVADQIAAHKTTIAMTRAEAADGQSTTLRAAARTALPILRDHLWMLRHSGVTPASPTPSGTAH